MSESNEFDTEQGGEAAPPAGADDRMTDPSVAMPSDTIDQPVEAGGAATIMMDSPMDLLTPIRELTDEDRAQLAELDDALEKFESQKRWSDVIRTILAKAEIVVTPLEKVALLTQAGNMYIERSSNQAEAIKCFEGVLEHDPTNADAMAQLKQMYEKRRDWERLIRIMQMEAELLDEDDKPLRYVEMADLATQRLRKPDICIELWQLVLDVDPDNPDALENLSQLYERARDWEPLARVLSKLTERTADPNELKQQLQKLGMIYADKIGDDAGAVGAFQRLLELDPNDRRAQEQLKRRYISLKAWDELELFYESSEKWDELIRIIEREADGNETSDEDKIALLFRAARLWIEKKDKADRAARAYEKILDTDPDNLQAAEALSPIYEQANDPRKLVNVFEVRLRHIDNPNLRMALLRECGALYEERLRDPATAFDRYLDAFLTQPGQPILREDVERVAPSVEGGWERVVAAYAKAIEDTADPDEQTELRMSFGGVLRQLERVEEAIAQYRSVYDTRPEHGEAIAALGQLYRQTENYRELLEIYERRMELETDPEQRRAIAYGKASLWQSELDDADEAIVAYQAILDEYGDQEMDAFRALDSLFFEQSRWSDLAAILERRIDLGPDSHEELAALKFRLALTLEQHLDAKERAVELYREVLTLLPEHDGARDRLQSLMGDALVGVMAARILEPVYEMRGEWELLIKALRTLHAGSTDPDERLELMTKIGQVYGERVGDASASFDAACAALRGAPGSADTLAQLEILAVEQERFRELVELVAELAGSTTEPGLSRTLWIKAATMYDEQLQDVDGAVGAYGRVLDQDPGDLEVLYALEMLYRRTERWRDLVTILRRRAEHAVDPVEKEELLGQMAAIHDEFLGEPDSAIAMYREILELDPTSGRALAALDDLLARQELWSDLADNVDRQLGMATDPEVQTGLMLRLADIRETRMANLDAAIEMYRDVLERDMANPTAMAALERLLQNPDHQSLICEILEPIYRDTNQFAKLIGVHEIQAQHASSPDRRVELLHQICELYEMALDNPQKAFEAMSRAVAEDPANPRSQENLSRLSRVVGGAEDQARVYEEQVQNVEDPLLAAQLHVKAAEIREEQLGDHAGAIQHYQRVLELDDQNIEAATALERLFQLSERYEDLANIYLTKARMLSSPEDQKGHLFRAAAIFEELLERPEDSITVYHQVLEIDPEDVQALDKLIELYLRLEQWQNLLGVYTRKADIVFDPDEKKRLYVEVGAVYERELNDVDSAIDTYQRILEIDPDDLIAIGRLDALYQATENWQELMSVLEREADLAHDPTEVISYRYRIAELWHRKLDDAIRAVDIYRDILDVVPDHEPTLNALESMVSEGLEPLGAAGVLEPVYRQVGEWAKLIAVHEVQIAHEQDPLRKVELLHQVAELYEFQLDQPREAFGAFARAVPLDNMNELTLQSLERLGENINAWQEVTRLYDQEIEKLREDSPHIVADMALRTAQIYEVQVGDVNAAIDHYRIVVEQDEGHVQAIESLDRLYEATERWSDLASILQKEIMVAASPDDILNLQFRLGQVYQGYLGQVDSAIEQYREILAAAPEHTPSMSALELLFAEGVKPLTIGEILEPLYRMQEAWDRLLNVHEVQLNYQPDPIERVSMMHRIAEIAEERAADHGRAFIWMQRALLEDAGHDHSQAEVERLSRILDGWSQLANTYADVVERAPEAEHKVLIAKRLARAYEEELGDIARAEEAFRFVLSVQPNDEESLSALDRIYVEHGAYNALAEILKMRVAASDHTDDKVELSHRLGMTLENQLSMTDEAIAVFQGVLSDLDPQHHPSIKALQDIYTRRSDWPNLYATFEREIDVVFGDQEQSQILGRMARLAHDQLADAPRAIELWRRVLDLRGEDPEALNALGDIHAKLENWAELVEILEREVSIVEMDEMRIRIFADLGRIWYEKLGRDRNSLESWERVLDIDPGNTDALFHIAEIYRKGNQWHELVDTLHRLIDVGAATLDDARLENVYMQLGHLYQTELQQPMDAVDAYRKVVEFNPSNFDAMNALELIHVEEAQWEDAIGVKETRARALQDPDQRVAQLLDIARAWEEQVEEPDRATSAYERIMEIDPVHAHAFGRLEELHRDGMRWEALIDLYVNRAEAGDDLDLTVRLLNKVAKVYEDELGDRQQAFDSLQLAWTLDYSDKQTKEELERVTGAINKWNDLLTVANQALQEAPDNETKIAICLCCAKWYGQELNHPEYAIPYYQQILAIDPANVPAMRQMAELYRTTQQWDTLSQVLGRLVEMTDDPVVKADTYVQMGDLSEEQLGNSAQAGSYYQRALDTDPNNVGALEALERIYRGQANWPKLMDILQRKAKALEDEEEVQEAKLQIAEAYEDRLQEVDEAIAQYAEVLEADETCIPAMKGLERLYARTERWQDLLQILERQYEVVTTEKERITILSRVASMYEEEFVKPDLAAERLEAVLDIDPTHEGALRGLARLYHGMQRWEDLINTYDRHVSATPDRGEKVRIFKAVGEVWGGELNDTDRAVDAYLNVLNISEHDVEALDALTRLYDKRGDHSSALEMMEQLSILVDDPGHQVDLKFRMGKIMDEQLGDRASALDHYQTALDLDPGHLPSLEAMRLIHIDNGDWLAAARGLEQETQYQENPRIISKLLVELGQIYDERLDEHDRAIEVFEAALKQDPDSEEASLPLAHEYMSQRRFEDAFPLLDLLVKASSKRETSEQHQLCFMLGEAASSLGRDEDAIKALNKAYQLDSTHLPSLLGLAAAYYRAEDWDKAFKFYQMLLVHHRDSLDREQITDIFYRLGVIKREQGERRKALNMFDKALEEDGYHRPTLEAVVGLYQAQNEWEQVIHFKKQILEVATDEERFDLLSEIGDLWNEKVGNKQKAIQAYADAGDLSPDDHRLLHKLLILYQETRQWEKAIEIIEQISSLDDRVTAKSKYAYTVAVIIRDELKDPDGAIDKFNEALDLDPEQLKAFEAINKLLNQTKDWKQLERAFRKMLHRIMSKGNTELEFNLWHNLGIIYRDRQRNFEAAAEAFRMASNLRPESATEHQILAELFAVMPERVGDAISEHQWLLRQDPYRVDSYRALYKLYFDARAYDKAWCLASTLTFLKKADGEQEQFYSQYKQAGVIRPSSRVDNATWVKELFHPDEDLYVAKIMEILAPAVHAAKVSTDKALRLNKKYLHDPASSTVTFARTFGFVSQVLNIPIVPRLFLQSEAPGGLMHVPGSSPPAIVTGATLLSGYSPQDLAFVIGRYLAYYRPEHFIRTLMSSHSELRTILLAGLRLAGVGQANPTVDQTAQALQGNMQPAQADALRSVARRFAEAGGAADIKRWMQTVELTAIRTGFLVCGDLDTARRMIQALPPEGAVDLPPKDKIKELVLFSVSESYFKLRETLGITIQV